MAQITLVLHNIRSTHNVGSIFRTAEGLGVTHIICSGYTPYPFTESDTRLPHIAQKLTAQIHKTALGAETMVPFTYIPTLETWIESYPHTIIGLEQSSRSVILSDYSPPKEFALILGEEVNGISKEHLDRCDTILEIPMQGKKESFNVSVAAAIALYVLFTSK